MNTNAKIIAACALSALAAGSVTAGADSLINGAKLKDGTVASRKLSTGLNRERKSNLIRIANLERLSRSAGAASVGAQSVTPSAKGEKGDAGSAGRDGSNGHDGANGHDGSDANVSSGNWGTVDRNTIGDPSITLRGGPAPAPLGKGSLGILVRDGQTKAAYGNEVDFAGDKLSGLTKLGFSEFVTGEDNALSARNSAGLGIEVDPTGPGNATAPNYSTLVYLPPALPSNVWTTVDATTEGDWYFTGAAGTASGCNQTTSCTLAQAQAAFPDATVLTVQITKGRDYAFQGAIDALVVNDKTFDFEESGVR